MTPNLRNALACAWPSMLLAAMLVVPFLNSPFTIDDPIYLHEAEHVLTDPLHPQAFDLVWSTDLVMRASQILPGGVFVPYMLVPTALTGSKEWAGHLTQIVLLLAAILITALAALRLDFNKSQASMAALLTASCPAVLGMAGTVMPDIAAMLFVILGMERILAWREFGRWHQAIAASCWFALAALTRVHTILILAAVFVLLSEGISLKRFFPILLTPLLYFAATALTADSEQLGESFLATVLSSSSHVMLVINTCSFLADFVVVIPLTIAWFALRFNKMHAALPVSALILGCMLYLKLGWVSFALSATLAVLADILWDAIERRDRLQFALWLWLLLGAPVVFYLYMAPKFLLPSVPAAAILIVRAIPERRRATRWLIPTLATAGALLGLLILTGIRDLGETQRRAVTELIEPAIKSGERVWFTGHWGFQWYAEKAGASPTTLEPPLPQPGDTVVVSKIDLSPSSQTDARRQVLKSFCYASSSFGRVMDFHARAGFFASVFGYLPWRWGSGEASCFEVWRME